MPNNTIIMPTYTLEEFMRMMETQGRRDSALMLRCIDGLGMYAAQIAEADRGSPKIGELRQFADMLVSYWGLDDSRNAKRGFAALAGMK